LSRFPDGSECIQGSESISVILADLSSLIGASGKQLFQQRLPKTKADCSDDEIRANWLTGRFVVHLRNF
jgi:hypothetical protein